MQKQKKIKLERPKLTVEKDKDGHEYVMLDVIASHFFNRTRHAIFALVTQNLDQLPRIGFVIAMPTGNLLLGEQLRELQIRAENKLEIHPNLLPSLPKEVLALGIVIKGGVEERQYTRGSRMLLTSGILETGYIKQWKNWRFLDDQWIEELWAGCALNVEVLDVERYRSKVSQRKMGFSPIAKYSGKERKVNRLLMLVISLLFTYWERNNVSPGDRAITIERLGFFNSSNNLSTLYGESGCKSLPPSVAKRKLEAIQNDACKYFEKHPEELDELRRFGFTTTTKVWLLSKEDEEEWNRMYVDELSRSDRGDD